MIQNNTCNIAKERNTTDVNKHGEEREQCINVKQARSIALPCPVTCDYRVGASSGHNSLHCWNNLHSSAISITKHQLTRLMHQYKLGFPVLLESTLYVGIGKAEAMPWCVRNKMWELVLIFNPNHLPFICVNILRKPSHTGVHARWTAAINMPFLPLSLFWLLAVPIHRKVNWAQQSLTIRLHGNSQFWICSHTEQYNSICFCQFKEIWVQNLVSCHRQKEMWSRESLLTWIQHVHGIDSFRSLKFIHFSGLHSIIRARCNI